MLQRGRSFGIRGRCDCSSTRTCTTFMLSREGSLRGLLTHQVLRQHPNNGWLLEFCLGNNLLRRLFNNVFFCRNLMIVTVGDPSTIGGRIELPRTMTREGLRIHTPPALMCCCTRVSARFGCPKRNEYMMIELGLGSHSINSHDTLWLSLP